MLRLEVVVMSKPITTLWQLIYNGTEEFLPHPPFFSGDYKYLYQNSPIATKHSNL